jgi:hypothetical protein
LLSAESALLSLMRASAVLPAAIKALMGSIEAAGLPDPEQPATPASNTRTTAALRLMLRLPE